MGLDKEETMATCKMCRTSIEVPEGWSVGAAVRRHYWAEHPDRMLRSQADRAAESELGRPAPTPTGRATGAGMPSRREPRRTRPA